MTKWAIGDKLTDSAWPGLTGTVVDVDDYGDGIPVVVFVRWDNGHISDFTPGPETKRVSEDQRHA